MPFEIDHANKQVKILMDFADITGCQDCKFNDIDEDDCTLMSEWSPMHDGIDVTKYREGCPLFTKEVDE